MSGGTSVDPDTMPKKNTYNFGHPKNKKKRNKNKPKRDGGEETEVKDREDHDEGGSSSDAASGDRDVEPAKSAAASRNEPLQVGETGAKFRQVEIAGKGQGLVATERLPVGRAA